MPLEMNKLRQLDNEAFSAVYTTQIWSEEFDLKK